MDNGTDYFVEAFMVTSSRNKVHETRASYLCYERKPMNGWISRVKATRSDEAAWSSVAHIESYSQPKSAHKCEPNTTVCVSRLTSLQRVPSCKQVKIAKYFSILKY